MKLIYSLSMSGQYTSTYTLLLQTYCKYCMVISTTSPFLSTLPTIKPQDHTCSSIFPIHKPHLPHIANKSNHSFHQHPPPICKYSLPDSFHPFFLICFYNCIHTFIHNSFKVPHKDNSIQSISCPSNHAVHAR